MSSSTQAQWPIEAVIFDLDGTILDTESLSAKAVDLVARKFGKSVQWPLQKKLLGLRGSEWSCILIEELGLRDDITPVEVIELWERNLHDMLDQVVPMHGAISLVETCLKLKLPMAIATSCNSRSAIQKLQRHPAIMSNMSSVIAGDDPDVRK